MDERGWLDRGRHRVAVVISSSQSRTALLTLYHDGQFTSSPLNLGRLSLHIASQQVSFYQALASIVFLSARD